MDMAAKQVESSATAREHPSESARVPHAVLLANALKRFLDAHDASMQCAAGSSGRVAKPCMCGPCEEARAAILQMKA